MQNTSKYSLQFVDSCLRIKKNEFIDTLCSDKSISKIIIIEHG